MKTRSRGGVVVGLIVAALTAGTSLSSVAAADATSSGSDIPASVIQALATGTPQQNEAVLETLTPAQLTALMTPVKFVTSTGVEFTASNAAVSPTQDVATAEQITPVDTPTVNADAVGAVNNAKNCSPNSTWAPYWIDAKNAFGLRLYRWHDDIEWYWNCQTINDAFYHYAYASDLLAPIETWKSTPTDTMTKAGTPTGIAEGQGEMAACVGFSFFSGCFDNSAPYIHISFDAFGNSQMTGYGT